MSELDRELVTILAVGAIVLDSLFLGVIQAALLMLLGRGAWYTSAPGGERIVYRGRHGVLFGGISFTMPNRVVVSDKRFAITIAWSRAALVMIPIDAVLSTTRGTWWWHATIRVAFIERGRRRTVTILASRPAQTDLVTAMQSVVSTPASVRSTLAGDDTA